MVVEESTGALLGSTHQVEGVSPRCALQRNRWPMPGQVVFFAALLCRLEAEDTAAEAPNLDHGDAQKHSVALGAIRDGQFAIPPFPRVWLRPSGSVWEGEGAS